MVHCSAGVGRSGTFVALDWLLEEAEGGAWDAPAPAEGGPRDLGGGLGAWRAAATDRWVEDPIADAVAEMRRQRMTMVQNEEQFAFLYTVAKEAWEQRARAHRAAGR